MKSFRIVGVFALAFTAIALAPRPSWSTDCLQPPSPPPMPITTLGGPPPVPQMPAMTPPSLSALLKPGTPPAPPMPATPPPGANPPPISVTAPPISSFSTNGQLYRNTTITNPWGGLDWLGNPVQIPALMWRSNVWSDASQMWTIRTVWTDAGGFWGDVPTTIYGSYFAYAPAGGPFNLGYGEPLYSLEQRWGPAGQYMSTATSRIPNINGDPQTQVSIFTVVGSTTTTFTTVSTPTVDGAYRVVTTVTTTTTGPNGVVLTSTVGPTSQYYTANGTAAPDPNR